MAVWDLQTPSSSQGPGGTGLRGPLWGASHSCVGPADPQFLTGVWGTEDEGDFVGGGHGCVGHPQPDLCLDLLPTL